MLTKKCWTIYKTLKKMWDTLLKMLKKMFATFFGLFGWLVADGWCWFVLREEYCWLLAGG
jgi:hypothetical protein